MGLDSLQIIMDTEQCFGVEIDGRAAEKMRTVGDLVDHVWHKIEHTEQKACLTQILFFRLRKFFCTHLNSAADQFTPHAFLSNFATHDQYKTHWPQLETELKLTIPKVFTKDRFLFFFTVESDTVLDLLEGIIYKNVDKLSTEYGLGKDTVFSIIAAITHDIVGAPRKDITASARFVDDLGVS